MLYQIHEVSKMTGLSVNGIRYYERQGVVTPIHRKGGGYRLYGIAEISAINRAINYRQMGFSLPDSARLANIQSFPGILGELDRRAEELGEELREKARLLRTIRARAALIEEIRARGSFCTVEKCPDLLWTPTYHWEGVTLKPQSDSAMALAASLGPGASPSVRISPEELMGEGEALFSLVGHCLDTDASPGHAEDPRFERLLPRKCIYAAVHFSPHGPLLRSHIAHVLAYAREHGLTFCSSAFSRRTIALQPEQGAPSEIYSQFWFPIA